MPFARSVHNRGVLLDKAAVLHYARMRARDGRWVSCECCFTIVHDVLVACTSIYLRGEKSERRALEAPQIRRIFSCSPRDPRYHMLEYLSPKFRMPAMEREPRAALILNRFTRNLSIMFATNAVSTILGLRPDEIKDRSFYECIQENCIEDASRCLESAKANESIAYLRFWFRDPRVAHHDQEDDDMETEEEDETTTDSESGGAELEGSMDIDSDGPLYDTMGRRGFGISDNRPGLSAHTSSSFSEAGVPAPFATNPGPSMYRTAGTTPGTATETRARHDPTPGPSRNRNRNRQRAELESIELEAVVSCTSDGLVVVLRKARPLIPAPHPPLVAPMSYENGLFAAPWGQNPIRPQLPPELLYTFRPPLMPEHMPLRESVKAAGGPPSDQLMKSIRDVAVFAWALVGINGTLATYGRGQPRDRAVPEALPIWDPNAGNTEYQGPENLSSRRWEKMPAKNNQQYQPPSAHFHNNPSPQPLEPTPLRHNFSPLQPSTLDHYTYGNSSTWAQPSTQFGREIYEQSGYRSRPDSFSQGPAVLPPLQPRHAGTEAQPQAYEPTPSFAPSVHGPALFQTQPQQPPAEASASQSYRPAPAPAPVSPVSPPTQGASINTLRYLWQ